MTKIIQIVFKNKKLGELADLIIHVLIFINIIVLCLETFDELRAYDSLFEQMEDVSVVIFIIEYIVRIISAINGRRLSKYIFSPLGLVDLISILPFELIFGVNIDQRAIKTFRMFRLFSLFKLYRYSEHLKTIFDVIYEKKGDLIATFFSIFIILLFCSYMMYYLEHDVQPEKIRNIFDALWWGVSTLGTIGYGDVYPITSGGKLIAAILALVGIGLVAIPSAILSAGFNEMNNKRKNKNQSLH